jgi:hypothetical protein
MYYAKVKGNQLIKYPYTFPELQIDNPYTNYAFDSDFVNIFPHTEEATIKGCKLVEVVEDFLPLYNNKTQKLIALQPILENNKWIKKWCVVDKTKEEIDSEFEEQSSKIRNQRTQKLKDSDWTQLADAPVNQAAWATYRQALRDVPSQAGFPWDVQWPIEP